MTKNTRKYIEISLYTHKSPSCFGQSCGHLQGCKIQRFDSLKYIQLNYICIRNNPYV